MATLPTPEETAREILAIFVTHFKARPEGVLRINSFLAVWHPRGLASADFKLGMEFAAEMGWVEVQAGGESFKLTSVGYEAAA
jgi:hypothetical protein